MLKIHSVLTNGIYTLLTVARKQLTCADGPSNRLTVTLFN